MAEVVKHVLDTHADERGWVINPIVPAPPGTTLGHVHVASLEPGAVRGNHLHPGSSEYMAVWGGRADVIYEREGEGPVREQVSEDELAVFEIPAGVAHAVANTGDTTIYLIAYYFGSQDEDWPDTERKPLV